MRKKISLIFILSLLTGIILYAQPEKKKVSAVRTDNPPKIDGLVTEEGWNNIPEATDFIQIKPYNGRPSTFRTIAKAVYDNEAIYFGIIMYDPHPDSIMRELTHRDEIKIDDVIGVYIDPFNDYQTAYGFVVTAAGVQFDEKAEVSGDTDVTWDAVWQSAYSINEDSWSVEFKIPYSALRFPKQEVQTWGLNYYRVIQRYRQDVSWNFINIEEEGFLHQAGELLGIEDIKPPVRLSFFPYVSGYVEKYSEDKSWSWAYNYGLDLKYGINESFTLDVTLIPDFGQVQSDDKIVNFSPFEIYYQERRPFFTEGTELFSRNGVFYSRRIGNQPDGYEDINDDYDEDDIIENPTETQLINATKLSGKTNKGLGIGVFNAMTANTYARVKDSTDKEVKILTQPFTNYNMVVFDQALKNNSFFSFYNTNVYQGKDYRTANVSGTDWQFRDKGNKYQFLGSVNVSQQYYPHNAPDLGFKYYLSLGKISGNFEVNYLQLMLSDTYNPNDLGFMPRNNRFHHNLDFEYNIYEPFGKVLEWYNELEFWLESLYAPREYNEFGMNMETRVTFINHLTMGGSIGSNPIDQHDYYEPRVDGWYFARPAHSWINVFFSPDYNKKFIVDFNLGVAGGGPYKTLNRWLNIRPRYRINDKLTINLNTNFSIDGNNLGYVTDSTFNNQPIIIFGKRNITNITNTLNISYIFNNKAGLSFRLRHYWLNAVYNQFYNLQSDGHLKPNDYNEDQDFSFNAFNIDMVFTWNFAPGSEILLVWKNAIYNSDEEATKGYFNNLKNILDAPGTNSFSVKFMYYLDYHVLKKTVKKVF